MTPGDRDLAEDEAAQKAQQYLDSPSIHNRSSTGSLLVGLLGPKIADLHASAESMALLRLVAGSHVRARLVEEYPDWTVAILFLPPLLFLSVMILLIVVFFMNDWNLAGWAAVACLGWRFYHTYQVKAECAQVMVKLASLQDRVQRLCDEIHSGAYDPVQIQDQLRKCGDEGVQFHSLVYALLRLRHEPRT